MNTVEASSAVQLPAQYVSKRLTFDTILATIYIKYTYIILCLTNQAIQLLGEEVLMEIGVASPTKRKRL
jgi:hypothetical protein